MCYIFRLFCCCCCCDSDKKQNKSLGGLPSKTSDDGERKVNLTVVQASTVTGIDTLDLTQVYVIPNRKFRTVNDVIKDHGFRIEWTDPLGRGRYGTAYKALHIKEQKVVAVKVLETDAKNESKIKDHKNELFIMEKTSHPHIIKVFTHFIIKDNIKHKNRVFIFMRFAENKSLSDYIRTKKVHFEEETAKRLFAQIVSGIDHMHNLGIAHMDLKLGNVLLDAHMNAMVSDFGLSRVLYSTDHKKSHLCFKRVGTTEYMAPEILMIESTKVPFDPFAGDIWALGVILYAMINRCYPFGDKPHLMLKQQIRYETINATVCRYYTPSRDLDDIIKKIFRTEPKDRITLTQLLKHNWIKSEIQSINDKINSRNLTKTSLSG